MRNLTRNLASALVALALPLSAALAMVACSGDDEPAPIAVATLTLQQKTLDLLVGESGSLTATMTPDNATNKAVKWTSSDTNVAASPTATGLTVSLTALNAGDTIITVTSEADATKTDTCTVTVRTPVPVDSVTLDKTTLTLRLEEPVGLLTATVLPVDATNRELDWTNSDSTIVGMAAAGTTATLTPLAVGTATITAASKADPNKFSTCAVTVLPVRPATRDIYVAGYSGVYVNGERDTRFPQADPDYIGSYGIEDVVVDAAGKIHACSTYINWDTMRSEAVEYVDGAMTTMAIEYGGSFKFSGVYAMTIDGSDTYIAGYTGHDTGYSWTTISPSLWKNGVAQPLGNNASTGEYCFADKVVVHNGIVYVGGYTDYNSSGDWAEHPVLWINGEEHVIRTLNEYTKVRDFGVASNGVLYVLVESEAYEPVFSVWEVQPSNLDSWTCVFELSPSFEKWWEVIHICVDGTDWYIVGYIDDDGYYWKNGGSPVKLQHPANLGWVEADDVYVLDGDVYIAGTGGLDDDWTEFRIVKWLNGEVITEGAITDILPGGENAEYNYARVRGLFVN